MSTLKNIFIITILLCFSTHIGAFILIPKVLNVLTHTANALLPDCPMNYEEMAPRLIPKLQEIILYHYFDSEKISYSLNDDAAIAESSSLNRNLPTVILIHGFIGNIVYPVVEPTIDALKDGRIANLIVVNHTTLTTDSYYVASAYTHFIGIAMGDFLSKLYSRGVRNFHLVGFSLGAHISGIAGKIFERNTFTKLDRITGLEPAGPCFTNKSEDSRLTKTDAKFVDVIHTDMNSFGSSTLSGHLDFFPNSGENLYGCVVGCGHSMAPLYFGESIVRNQFLAVKCSDWATFKSGACANNPRVVMGYWSNANALEGKYYLLTNYLSYYSRGEDGIVKPFPNLINPINIFSG